MAIVIPSKNIFEIDNQKVIDNQVDSIEIDGNNVSISRETKAVYQQDIINDGSISNAGTKQDLEVVFQNNGANNTFFRWAISYISVQANSYWRDNLFISRLIDNKSIIENLLCGKDGNGNNKITVHLRGKVTTGSARGIIHYRNHSNLSNIDTAGNKSNFYVDTLSHSQDTTNSDTDFDLAYEQEYQYSDAWKGVAYGDDTFSVSSSVSFESTDTLGIIQCEKSDFNFTLRDLRFVCGMEIYRMGFQTYYGSWSGTGNLIEGTYEKYEPTEIELNINGVVLTVNLQDEEIQIGNGKNHYSFVGNELIQTENSPSVEEVYNKIIAEYKNGKEMITLRCAIEDYYADNGDIIISKSRYNNLPMRFSIGDVICPYNYGANGIERAISLYKNGTAKQFLVIGSDITYDGAVFQRITGLEIYAFGMIEIVISGRATTLNRLYVDAVPEQISTYMPTGYFLEYQGEKAEIIGWESLPTGGGHTVIEYVAGGMWEKLIGSRITVKILEK